MILKNKIKNLKNKKTHNIPWQLTLPGSILICQLVVTKMPSQLLESATSSSPFQRVVNQYSSSGEGTFQGEW